MHRGSEAVVHLTYLAKALVVVEFLDTVDILFEDKADAEQFYKIASRSQQAAYNGNLLLY